MECVIMVISVTADREKFQHIEFDEAFFYKSIDERNAHIVDSIINTANQSIRKSSPKAGRKSVAWWNDTISQAIKDRKRSLNFFKKHPTSENEKKLKILKSKSRALIRYHSKQSWRKMVASINSNVPQTCIWKQIRSISGLHKSNLITSLKHHNAVLSNTSDIVELLGKYFSQVSSTENYSPSFKRHKSKVEILPLVIMNNNKSYNKSFSSFEFQSALNSTKGSSPRKDMIHYDMLKHLSQTAKTYLLKFYNRIWTEQVFPNEWRHFILIPILKPSKDPSLISSYSPISLTSCLCKLLERIVNKRLTWYIESNKILSDYQFGFRRGRSTIDSLTILESDIQSAFLRKQHTYAIFFDLEKVYDLTWRRQILNKLKTIGNDGNILGFVNNFLQNRKFQVLQGNTFSSSYDLENGIPQGAVLSVTLFLLSIDDITKQIDPICKILLYADGIVLYMSSNFLKSLQKRMQSAVNKMQKWLSNNGFRISVPKTSCMHFCRRKKHSTNLVFQIIKDNIQEVEEVRFLGMICDKKLSWRTQIEHVKKKSLKAMNIMKTLSNFKWGSDRRTLIKLHNSLVLSRCEYGNCIYSSASPKLLKSLELVHHQGLRIASGAFRSSPVISILVDTEFLQLDIRREKHTLSQMSRILRNQTHPMLESIQQLPIDNTNKNQTFPSRCSQILNKLCLELPKIKTEHLGKIAPWLLPKLDINIEQSAFPKNSTNSDVYKSLFRKMLYENSDYRLMFTDGSKCNAITYYAVFDESNNKILKSRLPNNSSVYNAELTAILKATKHIFNSNFNKYIIITDSLSALSALSDYSSNHPMIQSIFDNIFSCQQKSKTIKLYFVPSHMGIHGNEIADKAEKEASHEPNSRGKLLAKDFINFSKNGMSQHWENKWNNITENKYRLIRNSTSHWHCVNKFSKRDAVVLTRLRLGHTSYTHSYLMSKDNPPICDSCKQNISVQQIFEHCSKYTAIRKSFSNNGIDALKDNMKSIKNVINFMKQTDLYDLI
ncbi:uncharacterized protein LOC129718269 [Wyeomyia smithii]|uniref:uncharacterized protein LOC129718269 n=1 Tax=Wyeomyia smithii TaxID=174621 RepID=UPI002467EAF7|nr:uncharacterized protein LOC129718269 [Wyeomyia smithii]